MMIGHLYLFILGLIFFIYANLALLIIIHYKLTQLIHNYILMVPIFLILADTCYINDDGCIIRHRSSFAYFIFLVSSLDVISSKFDY